MSLNVMCLNVANKKYSWITDSWNQQQCHLYFLLQVILDVSFTKNPVIKLPLIVLPHMTSYKVLEAGLYPDLAKMNILN